jgi:hypothetical protein
MAHSARYRPRDHEGACRNSPRRHRRLDPRRHQRCQQHVSLMTLVNSRRLHQGGPEPDGPPVAKSGDSLRARDDLERAGRRVSAAGYSLAFGRGFRIHRLHNLQTKHIPSSVRPTRAAEPARVVYRHAEVARILLCNDEIHERRDLRSPRAAGPLPRSRDGRAVAVEGR